MEDTKKYIVSVISARTDLKSNSKVFTDKDEAVDFFNSEVLRVKSELSDVWESEEWSYVYDKIPKYTVINKKGEWIDIRLMGN